MAEEKGIKTILKTLKKELKILYKEKFVGLVLYGSYARGDANVESDIDIFVLLDRVKNPFKERQKFADIIWKLSLKNDIVISALPISIKEFNENRLPVISNARKEGIRI